MAEVGRRCAALLVLLVLVASNVNAQSTPSSTAGCTAGPNPCVQFTAILIQTVAGVTTITINATNLCSGPTYYVQFGLQDPNNLATVLTPDVDLTAVYNAHYMWDMSVYDSAGTGSSPAINWLRFTPHNGAPGVSGSPPQQTAMNTPSSSGFSWEIFEFQVTGYTPIFPWYWQAHVGSTWDTFGPLDMSECYCANCDAGYFQRLIQNCDPGYYNAATGTWDDASTSISESVFNENKILYAFTINGNWLEMFYSDEHALILGIDQVTYPDGSAPTTYTVNPGPQTPMCITTISVGSTDFNGNDINANIDQNGPSNGCTNGALTCGRPMPPSLFLTDITSNPTSRSGDWQFGGTAIPPNKICGLWKSATKVINSMTPSATSLYDFDIDVDPDPASNRNAAGTAWNLGAGADPLPILNIDSASSVGAPAAAGLGLDLYGAEIAWDLTKLPLNPSHNYRFQFMCHDGDQTKQGGDVGQACVVVTAACPPGYRGPNCTQCDLDPPPGDQLWTWYCFPTGQGGATPYNLVKIPVSKLTLAPYVGSGGFVPGNTTVDGEGYQITCNCERITYTCPLSCCGNGKCFAQNGTCACASTDFTNSTTCCQSIPQCYNNGAYCSGHGLCVNGACVCQNLTDGTTYKGVACNVTIPPPPPTCTSLPSDSCGQCVNNAKALAINCVWCPSSNNTATLLTAGTCSSTAQCAATNALAACIPPAVFVPPDCPDNCSSHGECVNRTSVPATTSTKSASTTPAPATQNQGSTVTNTNATKVCVCNAPYYGINCGGGPPDSNLAIIGGTIGGGVIAGIILAIVLCLGASGGGTYAAVTKAGGGPLSGTVNNPIYVGGGAGGTNPLHRL